MRLVRRLAVGSVLALLAGLVTAGSAFAPPPGCDLTQLQLRDSTINQGLGSFDPLVRGKETLVRLYFSLPSCHDNNDQIQITGGTLSVTRPGETLASGVVGTPTPVSTFPTAATYSAAPVSDAPADIKFVVQGSSLAPASTAESYAASFSATVTFQYRNSATGSFTAASKAFSVGSKTIEKRTNALRILVVPMGDAANAYSSEFPAEAVTAVENGMQTLSRLFPVPDGVGTLGGTSGGVRYAIDPTLLNVPLGADGKFCGTGANFDLVKSQLAQFLVSWNTANPGAQADRVMGAVWSGKSNGTPSCSEGMASLISPEGWVRAIPDTATTPSMTGALLAMETMHTFGLALPTRGFASHSLNTNADGTSLNRGYNVATRSFLSDDRTALKLTSGAWNNNTTLLEKADYAFLLCALGGRVNTECTTSNVAGTAGGVAALGVAYAATGVTDGTAAGTKLEESYAAPELEGLGLEAGSEYNFVQRGPGNAILGSPFAVRVAFDKSVHDDGNELASPGTGTFAFVVPLDPSAVGFELWKGTPGTGTLLWSREKTAQAPTITDFELVEGAGGETRYTETGDRSEFDPALSADGSWVAWESQGSIYVAPRSDSTLQVRVPTPAGGAEIPPVASDPAWSQATGGALQLAYVASGNIYTHDVDVADGTPSFSDPRLVYDAAAFDRSASDPSWNQDGTKLAFSEGRISVVDLETLEVTYLTNFGNEDPSWSRTSGDDRIAFVTGIEGSSIMVLDPNVSEPEATVLVENAAEPSWGTDGRLSFTRGGVWIKNVADGKEDLVVEDGSGSDLAGSLLAFSRLFPVSELGTQSDLILLSLAGGNVSVTVEDDNPEDNRLDLLVDCGSLVYVAAVALVPGEVSSQSASWEANYDPSLTCEGATLKAAVSDGYHRVVSGTGETLDSAQKPPTAAIYTPSPDAVFDEYDVVPARGGGWDAEDGTIPNADLDWVLSGPGGFSVTGRDGPIVDYSPPENGFPVGAYQLELTVTDSKGNTDTETRTFEIVEDADNDGLPKLVEEAAGTCITFNAEFGASADLDPLNAFRDDDNDGIVNVEDAAPCVATTSYEAFVDFDPEVSQERSGGVVTAYVKLRHRDIRQVDGSSVKITALNGIAVSVPAIRWNIDKGTGVAQFNRQALLTVLRQHNITNQHVLVTVEGSAVGGAWSFSGGDTTFVR